MAKNLPRSSNFGRQQRNIPTEPDKTAYDPDFGKPRPDPNKTVYDPDFGKSKPTDIKPPGPDLLKEQPPRTDLEEIEKAARGEATIKNAPKGPPEPMQAADLQKELAKAEKVKPGKAPDLKKLPPGKTLPQGTPGLAEYEKGAAKLAPTKIKPGKGVGFGAKTRSVLKNVGKIVGIGAIAGVLVFAILDHLGVAIFEHAADVVIEKMGPKTDLSDYLPNGVKANKLIWSAASYRRYSADPVSEELPLSNTLGEEITFHPPQNGILAFGISLGNLPEEIFAGEINVNGLGDGQSDWLCEEWQGYLICRSMSKSYPLISKLGTVVTLYFYLPAYEVKEGVAAGGGSREIYFIVK